MHLTTFREQEEKYENELRSRIEEFTRREMILLKEKDELRISKDTIIYELEVRFERTRVEMET